MRDKLGRGLHFCITATQHPNCHNTGHWIPRPGSDEASSKHGKWLPKLSQIRREDICPDTEVQGKSRGSSIAAILEHSHR